MRTGATSIWRCRTYRDALWTWGFALTRVAIATTGSTARGPAASTRLSIEIGTPVISRDRGRNVRYADGDASLAKGVFRRTNTSVRFYMLHIPYTHAILECRR